MRVLVIGSGAREHALVLSLRADPAVYEVICAPGNAGTSRICASRPVDVTSPDAIATLAVETAADLVVIGPEAPLVAGAADAVRKHGIACFGPSADAARLEGSKTFAKDVMRDAGVPTAASHSCNTAAEVEAALAEFGPPYVVKDDGLAGGKGVVVTDDLDAARRHAEACLAAGSLLVVEEYLDGPEVSLFCLTDGTTVVPLVPAQDFKRLLDGDAGPNTGGMGAYAPLPWAPPGLVEEVMDTVVQPTVDELAGRGTPFVGVVYAGLALTRRGVRVVEFNARFGDPETQSVLALLATPLSGLLYAAATGHLAEEPPLEWRAGSAVTLVLAAPGYPDQPELGGVVTAWADTANATVLHAGTADGDGDVVSSGGRVLSVVGVGADQAAARDAAYRQLSEISLAGGQYRTDIAAG